MRFLFITRSLFSIIFCLASTFMFATDAVSKEKENSVEEFSELLSCTESLFYDPAEDYLYKIQNSAYYHLVAFSDTGDIVQLHDASKWIVNPSHRHLVLYWVQSDDIFIKPCASWFSPYKYVLYNRTTRQAAEVNLMSPPLLMGDATLRVVSINSYACLIELSDRSIWKIDSLDYNFSYWQIGSRVLVGVNNGWRAASFPHILINADVYKEPYSQADFYGHAISY